MQQTQLHSQDAINSARHPILPEAHCMDQELQETLREACFQGSFHDHSVDIGVPVKYAIH